MAQPELTQTQLEEAGLGAFFRPRDVEPLGIGPAELRQLAATGVVERISRGLYHLAEAEPTEHHSLAAVCARVPEAVLCLLTALRYHELGTQLPREVWIGIARKARPPHLPELPIRVVRFNAAQLQYGVNEVRLEGVPARITNPARTVVDCFHPWKLRLVGKDVALEALREAIDQRKATPDEITRADEACRTSKSTSAITPYLEALAR
jgi:predicted transcriptional regulator of viral defense system